MRITLFASHLKPGKSPYRVIWQLGSLVLIITGGIWAFLGASLDTILPGKHPVMSEEARLAFEDKTGVRIVLVAVSAGGGMIDLRYQVIDPEKALIVHDAENPPAIIDEDSGQVFKTPWMNHLHDGSYQAGIVYYTLLMNSGGQIKPGDRVTVVVGGFSLEHLIVR
jgi:hypothetical protein